VFATRFLSGSHHAPAGAPSRAGGDDVLVRACGSVGSVIVYNGSVVHGHGPNDTDRPRRSIQGAYIRRSATSGFGLASRMRAETLERIGPISKNLIGV
jgi:ectoine hydroxylase-related dioxygenase (phytanoyl-CoA dioxygenase family)